MIHIENLSIDLGVFHLRDVDLRIEEGEYMVLLGPTGAGKTVLIECVVGIHKPGAGRVLIEGRDLTGLDPEERNVGFVPQDYCLFPNMTVRRNLAYGLKARRMPGEEVRERVEGMMDLLGISHLDYRLPLHLSGGEKQRVALGRALVTEPSVLLLDEPLAALDENLRSELAAELRRVQRQVHGTFLHVCHSFDETADVADRIAIMDEGRLVQVGTMADVLARPSSLFVARFTRTRNFFDGVAAPTAGGCLVRLGEGMELVSSFTNHQGEVTVGVRPEDIEILEGEPPDDLACLPASVTSSRPRPTHTEIELDAGLPLIVYGSRGGTAVQPGDRLAIRIPPEAVKVFPR
jgi:ABC-type Fe3+/spermidine/putrescine transport system ATPase subunit